MCVDGGGGYYNIYKYNIITIIIFILRKFDKVNFKIYNIINTFL